MTTISNMHVVVGESAADCLRQALGDLGAEPVIPLEDSVSCGPLAPLTSSADWAAVVRRASVSCCWLTEAIRA